MALTPAERTLRARAAAQARWAGEDPAEQARRMQAGTRAKFEQQVDPDGVLDPAERARRAESARRSHMSSLALKSVRARRTA